MTTPDVSVVIPTLGDQSLRDSIESIFDQSPSVEVIVVDGTETRDAEPIAEEFGVEYVHQGPDGGPHEAREIGARRAAGEYIQFLDDDDVLHPTKFETQIELLEDDDVGVAYCGFERNGIRELPDENARGDVLPEALSISGLSTCATSTMLIERELIEDLIPFPNKHGADDTGMEIELARRTEFEFVNEALVTRGSPDRETSRANIEGRKEILDRYEDLYDDQPPEIRQRALAAFHLRKGVREVESSWWSAAAIRSFWRSIQHSRRAGDLSIVDLLALVAAVGGRPGWITAKELRQILRRR